MGTRRLAGNRALEVGYAFAEPPYLAALLRAGFDELVGVDLAEADVPGMTGVQADVRDLPFDDRAFDLVLCVSTLEHVGADNSGYGLDAEDDGASRLTALRELRRVLAPSGRLLITVPCGEPGDYGWFHQDDVRGWTRLFTGAGFFVEEQEVYELTEEGWRTAPELVTAGLRYGERGPAASAVLCAELSPRRLRRLLSPDGIERTARRRAPHPAGSAGSPERGRSRSKVWSQRPIPLSTRLFDPGGNECACCWSTTMLGSALLRTTFEDVQVEVDEAGSAAEAESRIAASRPDVIVLDVGMPGMDGLAFCRELKASEDTREIRIVLLTGMDDVEDVAGAAGADALLLKPFRPLELLGVVERLAGAGVGAPMRRVNGRSDEEQLVLYARDLRHLVEIERAQRGLLESAYKETVSALASALGTKDTGTRQHSQRVQRYALELPPRSIPRLPPILRSSTAFCSTTSARSACPTRSCSSRSS